MIKFLSVPSLISFYILNVVCFCGLLSPATVFLQHVTGGSLRVFGWRHVARKEHVTWDIGHRAGGRGRQKSPRQVSEQGWLSNYMAPTDFCLREVRYGSASNAE